MRKIESKRMDEEAPPVQEEPEPLIDTPTRRARNLDRRPLWDRVAEIMEQRGTTPRDILEGGVWNITGPEATMKNVRFSWIGDVIRRRQPMLSGYRHDIWQPVTPDVMEELQITVATKDRTAEGVPRILPDASLFYCPERIAKMQDEAMRANSPTRELLHQEKKRLKELARRDSSIEFIGKSEMVKSEGQFARAEERERREIGTPYQDD